MQVNVLPQKLNKGTIADLGSPTKVGEHGEKTAEQYTHRSKKCNTEKNQVKNRM